MRRMIVSGFVAFILSAPVAAQDRPLPEELKTLAAACASSSTDVRVQGELEAGINKIFGKVLAGSGEVDYAEVRKDFVNSFSGDTARLEAMRIMNDCVISLIDKAYAFRGPQSAAAPPKAPSLGGIEQIDEGTLFTLDRSKSIALSDGTVVAIYSVSSIRKEPTIRLSNSGTNITKKMHLGDSIFTNGSKKCTVTYYSVQSSKEDEKIYSFYYDC